MYTANVLAFSKGTDAAKWIGLVVAVLGVALLFYDLVMNIKKRNHTKMNIVAMVFLCLSLVCYILTQWVLTDLPPLFGFIWVVFLVAYLVCDVVMAVGIGRDNHRKKRGLVDPEEEDDANTDDGAAAEQDVNTEADAKEVISKTDDIKECSADEQIVKVTQKPARKKGKGKKNAEKLENTQDVEIVNMLDEQDSDGSADPTE